MSPATSDGERTTCEETSNDCVQRVLSLSNSLDGTVISGEQTTPNTKITTNDRNTGLDGTDSTWETLTVWRVSETLETVPNATTDDLKMLVLASLTVIIHQRDESLAGEKHTPMAKAPPKSLRMTIGHGSLVWSADMMYFVCVCVLDVLLCWPLTICHLKELFRE